MENFINDHVTRAAEAQRTVNVDVVVHRTREGQDTRGIRRRVEEATTRDGVDGEVLARALRATGDVYRTTR